MLFFFFVLQFIELEVKGAIKEFVVVNEISSEYKNKRSIREDDESFVANNLNVKTGDILDNKKLNEIELVPNKSIWEQVVEKNVIYKIKSNFDLQKKTLEIPLGCILDFQGGSLCNGILKGNNTILVSPEVKIFNSGLKLSGSFGNRLFLASWFGVNANNEDNATYIQYAIDNILSMSIRTRLVFSKGVYTIAKPIIINGNGLNIDGNHSIFIKSNTATTGLSSSLQTEGGVIDGNVNCIFCIVSSHYSIIENIIFKGASKVSNSVIGLFIVSASNLKLDYLHFYNCNYGMFVYNSWMNDIGNIKIISCLNGFKFTSDRLEGKTFQSATSTHFHNCWVKGGRVAYDLDWVSYSSMTCCAADECIDVYRFHKSQINMSGCGAEAFTGKCLQVSKSNIAINSCLFYNTKPLETTNLISIEDGSFFVATACRFSHKNNLYLQVKRESYATLIDCDNTNRKSLINFDSSSSILITNGAVRKIYGKTK